MTRLGIDYRNRYNAIRKYVNLKVTGNPTPSEKRTITRYYNALHQYGVINQIDPLVYVFKSKSRKVQRAAIKATRADPGFPKLKVAIFRNVLHGEIIKTRIRKGKVEFEKVGKYETVRMFLFSDHEKYPGEFVENPDAVVKRIMRLCKGADSTKFMCGKHLEKAHKGRAPDQILIAARRWIARYDEDSREAGQLWSDWMRGIEAIWYTNQKRSKHAQKLSQKAGKPKKARGNAGRRNRPVFTW